LQHYTRDLKVLTLEACIRKMTSLPAAVLGLHDRGFVRKGQAADLVVFNPESLEDTATYENPRNHPRGIEYVLVNGKVVVEHGKHTGVLAGQVLRRQA
jgi:N-acyl-D-aspartate/D-glutamate deacylase